jgi:hypothetical protein
MPSEYTEADKARILSVLSDIIKEDKYKYHVYHDIYHVLKDSCDCKVPDSKILPEREDLLRFLQKKCMIMSAMGSSMSVSSSWWETFPQRMHSPLPEDIFIASLMTLSITMNFFMVILVS